MRDWNGTRVIVVGAARQGIALASYLAEHRAQVVLNDRRPINELAGAASTLQELTVEGQVEWVCGGHPLELLDRADLVCLSGGVPLTLPLIQEAKARGIPLSNDSQIFLETAPCKVIGITGSAGKTTTTTLVGRMAESAENQPEQERPYRRSWVGGNIGTPLIGKVDQMTAKDLAILELSSFQLELMDRSPQIAAVLNITPNHLDRHRTMEDYIAAKARIIDYQNESDIAVLGRDDPGSWSLAGRVAGKVYSFGLSDLKPGSTGAFFRDGRIYLRDQEDFVLMSETDISLRGQHNISNIMAACTTACAAGLPVSAIRAGVTDFRGVPHRLEYVRTWGGADWYNDSIATAPERAMAAIRSFDEPLVLLAGGRDKDLPWDEFGRLVRQRVDHLIVFGEAADIILDALKWTSEDRLTVNRYKSMEEAVLKASEIVEPGSVVLLSPGGTSFDEFRDFEERGECFVQLVKELP